MTVGALDGVSGLGPKRRARLIEQFGGLSGLRGASRDELLGLSWLPAQVGAAVFERLHTPLARAGTAERPTVGTATEHSDTETADTATADTETAGTVAVETEVNR